MVVEKPKEVKEEKLEVDSESKQPEEEEEIDGEQQILAIGSQKPLKNFSRTF